MQALCCLSRILIIYCKIYATYYGNDVYACICMCIYVYIMNRYICVYIINIYLPMCVFVYRYLYIQVFRETL